MGNFTSEQITARWWEEQVGKPFQFPDGKLILLGVMTRGNEKLKLIFPEFVVTPEELEKMGATEADAE